MRHFFLPLFWASFVYAQVFGGNVSVPIPVQGQPGAKGVQIQAGAPSFGSPAPKAKPLPADQVLAHIGKEAITAGKLRDLLTGAPETALRSAQADPAEFLTWTELMRLLSATAQKDGIDKQSPYSDRLSWTRNQVLMMAQIEHKQRESVPGDAEAKTWYEENALQFGTAKVKLIYVAADEGKEEAAKAKVDGILKQLAAGADFSALARKNSDDQTSAAKGGEFQDVGPESRLPVEVRKAIFQTKPGKWTTPVQQPGGYYIFQVTSIALKPFAEMRDAVMAKIKEERSAKWIDEQRKGVEAKILNEEVFAAIRAASFQAGAATATPAPSADVKPETVLARVNGRDLTAKEFTGVLQAVPPSIRTNAVLQPKQFLEQFALMERLAGDAVKAGLDQRQPYRGRLTYNSREILMQSAVDQHLNSISILPDEQKKAFDANQERYRYSRTKMLYVSYSLTPPPQTDPNAPKILNEEEARRKIEKIANEARLGEDFVKLVRLHSEHQQSKLQNGDMPPMRGDDPQVPPEVRKLVFAAKKGELVGPLKLANGFYLFRVQEQGTRSYEEVKDAIYDELRQEQFQKWFDGLRAAAGVKVDDPIAFRQVLSE